MSENEALDFLEQRLSAVEHIVFGQSEKDADYPKNEKLNKQLIDSLLDIHKKIGSSMAGKKKAVQLYEKLPQLRKCLDHSYTDELLLSNEAKEETVLAASEFLTVQASLLQKLSEHQQHINSEHVQENSIKCFSTVPKLSGKLQALSQVQIDQQDEMSKVSEETRSLLSSYNNVVSLLSKQFILWDEQITLLEQNSQKK